MEAGRLAIQSQLWLHGQAEVNLGYMRPCLKIKIKVSAIRLQRSVANEIYERAPTQTGARVVLQLLGGKTTETRGVEAVLMVPM